MNKYQEALKNINIVCGMDRYRLYNPTKLLQELVDKATPMKVIITTQEHFASCNGCGYQEIPIVKWYDKKTHNLTSIDIRIKFCPYCGQAIDWSKES